MKARIGLGCGFYHRLARGCSCCPSCLRRGGDNISFQSCARCTPKACRHILKPDQPCDAAWEKGKSERFGALDTAEGEREEIART
jgi:hypothetical protein